MQNDIVFSLSQLLWIIGGITAIGAFIKWIMAPMKRLDDHETRIKALETAEEERRSTDRFTTKALNAIVNFLIDGKDTEKLKEVRDEYQESIINHHM